MRRWKRVLSSAPSPIPGLDAYGVLFEATWVPVAQRALLGSAWDTDAVLSIVEEWEQAGDLIPPHVKAYLMTHRILPPILAALEKADPEDAAEAINSQLLPWLPHCSEPGLLSIVPVLGPLFGRMARGFDPATPDVVLAWFGPWARASSVRHIKSVVTRFVRTSILPRVREYAEAKLTSPLLFSGPRVSNPRIFHPIFAWSSILSRSQLSSLCLSTWALPFARVALSPQHGTKEWLSAWTGLIPRGLKDLDCRLGGFLAAVEGVVGVGWGVGSGVLTPFLPSVEQSTGEGGGGGGGGGGEEELGFRDVVERYLGGKGIAIVPRLEEDGMRVWECEGTGVVLRLDVVKEVVWIRQRQHGGWVSTSLQGVVDVVAAAAAAGGGV